MTPPIEAQCLPHGSSQASFAAEHVPASKEDDSGRWLRRKRGKTMEYTTLGRTGLQVSVAGLGCGGFSRLGMSSGRSEAEAADVVRTALDLGVTYIDTAEAYGTEGAVGLAIGGRQRDEIVV